MDTFTPYPCSLGTVTGHEAGHYIIATNDGRTVGILANGEPSPAAVEADLANPPAVPPAPRRQASDVVLDRMTDAEVLALTGSAHPAARRAWLAATSTGIISEDDARFPQLRSALDQLGIIASARWDGLLAP
jgi:hypothetical protein